MSGDLTVLSASASAREEEKFLPRTDTRTRTLSRYNHFSNCAPGEWGAEGGFPAVGNPRTRRAPVSCLLLISRPKKNKPKHLSTRGVTYES